MAPIFTVGMVHSPSVEMEADELEEETGEFGKWTRFFPWNEELEDLRLDRGLADLSKSE